MGRGNRRTDENGAQRLCQIQFSYRGPRPVRETLSSMILQILDDATAEFAEAIAHYEGIESGLGVRFRQEVHAVTVWIERTPSV